jgi:hypothetical protein
MTSSLPGPAKSVAPDPTTRSDLSLIVPGSQNRFVSNHSLATFEVKSPAAKVICPLWALNLGRFSGFVGLFAIIRTKSSGDDMSVLII